MNFSFGNIRVFSVTAHHISSRWIFTRSHMATNTTVVAKSLIVEFNNPQDNVKPEYIARKSDVHPNDFFLAYPRGSYTGMRTWNRNAIVAFDLHMTRLVNSLSSMKFGLNEQGEEPKEVTQQLEPFRDVRRLQELLKPMLRFGLTTFHETVDPTTTSSHPWETKVSVLLGYSTHPFIAAHFSLLSAPTPHPVNVDTDHKARRSPTIKDSQWVSERAPLEVDKAIDVNEVLLIDDDDNVYEGMSSNFFVLRTRQEDGKQVLVCAPLEHVLLGTVMKLVMSVCERNGIPIEWTFPNLKDAKAGKWDGCFLTSTSRLLLPIGSIRFKDGSAPVEFHKQPHTTEFLRNEVEKETHARAFKIV